MKPRKSECHIRRVINCSSHLMWFFSFGINNKTIGSEPWRCKRRLFLFWIRTPVAIVLVREMCRCVGRQYMCFFSTLSVAFFPFQSACIFIFPHRLSSSLHSIGLHWHMRARDGTTYISFVFLRGISECEGQKKCKTQNRGFDFTASFEQTCHHYTSIETYTLTQARTHTRTLERYCAS